MIKNLEFKNANIRYLDKGKGKALVLLHGFPLSLEVWKEFCDELSNSFRVIAIDLPGHGKSDCLGYVHSMELMAQCVKAVVDHLGLRKYVLVGHSMGGYVVLAFAELFPDPIKGLCLFHSSSLPDSDEKKLDRERAIEAVKKDHFHFISELTVKLFSPDNVSQMKNEIKRIKEISQQTSKQGIIAALEGMKERKNREVILKFATYPVLYIAGKKDMVLPYHAIAPQFSLVKDLHTLVLDDVGHMGFLEAKDETAAALKRFAGKCFRQ